MNNDSFDASVYVDVNTLLDWGTRLNTINETAMSCIKKFSTDASLAGTYEGSSASAFSEILGGVIDKAMVGHESMTNVNNFLGTVVEKMQEE